MTYSNKTKDETKITHQQYCAETIRFRQKDGCVF